jgi:hypothetical protein
VTTQLGDEDCMQLRPAVKRRTKLSDGLNNIPVNVTGKCMVSQNADLTANDAYCGLP